MPTNYEEKVATMDDRLIDAKEFSKMLCCGMTQFNESWQKREDFPKPLKLYAQKRVWRLSTAMEFLEHIAQIDDASEEFSPDDWRSRTAL